MPIVEYALLYVYMVQLDLNFKNTHVCNGTRTTRAAKISLRVSECTRN